MLGGAIVHFERLGAVTFLVQLSLLAVCSHLLRNFHVSIFGRHQINEDSASCGETYGIDLRGTYLPKKPYKKDLSGTSHICTE